MNREFLHIFARGMGLIVLSLLALDALLRLLAFLARP